MDLVAGIDSSTQSCTVVIREAESGRLVRQGRARHPEGTEVDPQRWWEALQQAVVQAGGLGDVAAARQVADRLSVPGCAGRGRSRFRRYDVQYLIGADDIVRGQVAQAVLLHVVAP